MEGPQTAPSSSGTHSLFPHKSLHFELNLLCFRGFLDGSDRIRIHTDSRSCKVCLFLFFVDVLWSKEIERAWSCCCCCCCKLLIRLKKLSIALLERYTAPHCVIGFNDLCYVIWLVFKFCVYFMIRFRLDDWQLNSEFFLKKSKLELSDFIRELWGKCRSKSIYLSALWCLLCWCLV